MLIKDSDKFSFSFFKLFEYSKHYRNKIKYVDTSHLFDFDFKTFLSLQLAERFSIKALHTNFKYSM